MADLAEVLDELRGPLAETYDQVRGEWLSVSRHKTSTPPSAVSTAEEKLWTAAYALRVHDAIRAQVPHMSNDEPFVVVGPATTLSTIIDAATRNIADDIGQLLAEPPRLGVDLRSALRERAAALRAWIETYVDHQAVEGYCFDPSWDPMTLVGRRSASVPGHQW